MTFSHDYNIKTLRVIFVHPAGPDVPGLSVINGSILPAQIQKAVCAAKIRRPSNAKKSDNNFQNEFRYRPFSSQSPNILILRPVETPFAMLKRKRENHTRAPGGGGPDSIGQRKGDVEEKLVHGKKMLNRALKTAKGFEWQKLVKRITNAKAEDGDSGAQVARLERELKMLKVGILWSCLISEKIVAD